MKAVLVMTSFVTRVIVEDTATDDEIILAAQYKHQINITEEFSNNVENILLDSEQMYDEKTDGIPIKSLQDVFNSFFPSVSSYLF